MSRRLTLLVASLSVLHVALQFAPPARAQTATEETTDVPPDTSTERLSTEGPGEQAEANETLQPPGAGAPGQLQAQVQAAGESAAQAQAGAQAEAQADAAEQAEAEPPPVSTAQQLQEAPPHESPAQRAARQQAEEAARLERMNELTAAVNQLNENQQLLDERTAAIEDEATAVRERGEGLEQARLDRLDAYDLALTRTGDVANYLTTGTDTGADAAMLELAEQLGELADNAYQTSGEFEAQQAVAAQDAVEAARDALAQGDLYDARISLGVARVQLMSAMRAAESNAQPLYRE